PRLCIILRAGHDHPCMTILVLHPGMLEHIAVDQYVLTVFALKQVLDEYGRAESLPGWRFEKIVVPDRNAAWRQVRNRGTRTVDADRFARALEVIVLDQRIAGRSHVTQIDRVRFHERRFDICNVVAL